MSDRLDEPVPDPESIVAFFEGTNFNEDVKGLASFLTGQMNDMLHNYCMWCKRNGVAKQDWLDSQKLALATCLKMRMGEQ